MQTTEVQINPQLNESWKNVLTEEFNAPYFKELKAFLVEEKKTQTIYPPGPQIFSAFNRTNFENLKVVIIGQDPYHGKGQANGLCFSVSPGIKPPPSLVNIYKEMKTDLGVEIPTTGNLEPWADQGILLLNATLTVRAGEPGSHQGKGWEQFTDTIIKKLSSEKKNLIFLLWGKFAQAKEALIDTSKHYVLKAAHPSPYSASAGFFGCKHFSKTNELLKKHNLPEIDWRIEK
ncbi:MAG: uracil-DNA glycosylase [Bacteroidetes bacterium]|nr:uracil-DNA glycosylase [Bacteroidota bacterium]